jgi:DNA helicase HerA-like ATPase
MLSLYRIENGEVQIISCPPQGVRKGEYLSIEDTSTEKSLIIQVVEIDYANVPGILEDILRRSSIHKVNGEDYDPLEIKSYIELVKDAKVLRCRIRGAMTRGEFTDDISWIPVRSKSRVVGIPDETLLKLINPSKALPIQIGRTRKKVRVDIDAKAIDGSLNIISGKKGTGKSHLAKTILLGLIDQGGLCFVFDINGEYTKLGYKSSGERNQYQKKMKVLIPGRNFKVDLRYAGLGSILSIMRSVMDTPGTSTWEFRRIWRNLERRDAISIKEIFRSIDNVNHEYVREALFRRFQSLVDTGFFCDDPKSNTAFEKIFAEMNSGGAVILDLKDLPSMIRKIVVEFVLSKLSQLLKRNIARAVFLFAEEAHLYLRDTYWEDIVTRMRHLGVFVTFVTNQPETIKQNVFRQSDNIFLFNFTNENDLKAISRASRIDVYTIESITRELPAYHCLMFGKVTRDLPVVVGIGRLDVQTQGETRFFFTPLETTTEGIVGKSTQHNYQTALQLK